MKTGRVWDFGRWFGLCSKWAGWEDVHILWGRLCVHAWACVLSDSLPALYNHTCGVGEVAGLWVTHTPTQTYNHLVLAAIYFVDNPTKKYNSIMSTQLRVPLWHVWAVCLSAELLLFFALCYWSAHPDLTFHTPGSSCGSKLPYPACNNVCLLNCVCVCLFIGWSLCVDVEQVRSNVLASFTECEPLQIPGWCWGFPVLRRATPQTLSIPVMRTIQSNMMWDCGTVDCVTACIFSADITPEAHITLVIKAIRESVSVCVNFISVLFYKWQTHAVTPPPQKPIYLKAEVTLQVACVLPSCNLRGEVVMTRGCWCIFLCVFVCKIEN